LGEEKLGEKAHPKRQKKRPAGSVSVTAAKRGEGRLKARGIREVKKINIDAIWHSRKEENVKVEPKGGVADADSGQRSEGNGEGYWDGRARKSGERRKRGEIGRGLRSTKKFAKSKKKREDQKGSGKPSAGQRKLKRKISVKNSDRVRTQVPRKKEKSNP